MKGYNLHGPMEFFYRCVYVPSVEWFASVNQNNLHKFVVFPGSKAGIMGAFG